MTTEAKSAVLYQRVGLARAKKLANELQAFCKANHLIVKIAEKDYMMSEGWQFIGTQMGLTDIVKYCEPVEGQDKEIKYKAEVEIINQNGTVISRGIAFCSNKEKKKSSFEEYAIASMAQTRAVGKAYRNFLAWIVKMAGYESMPAEEANRDQLESDLAAAKRNVVRAFHKAGVSDSSEMMRIIETVLGENEIATVDDAKTVTAYLRELEGQDAQGN